MKTAEKLLEQAKSWLGLKKSDGSYQIILDTYNAIRPLPRGHKMNTSDAWCACFVSACAAKCDMLDLVPAECSCNQMIALLKKIGAWREDESLTPAPGWILFYDWQDDGKGDNTAKADHVGIVEKVDGSTITVIEGNYSGAVKRRTMKVNGRYIRGYGVPAFEKAPRVFRDDLARPTTHTVVPGDTPEKIARKYAITPQVLIAANIEKYPRMTIDFIRDGWVLTIPPAKVEAKGNIRVRVTAKSGLNVRTDASTKAEKRGALSCGETVSLCGKSEDGAWGMILYKGKPGWIALGYTREV